jgi:hypothetical protein
LSLLIDKIDRLTRTHFELNHSEITLIEEHWPIDPGFPPRMTQIYFWLDVQRYGFLIFKRMEDVHEADFPPKWMKTRLQSFEPMGCSCC